jgi:hypothetical protein
MLQLVGADADERVQLLQTTLDERDRELRRARIEAANATSASRECDAACRQLQAQCDEAQAKLDAAEVQATSAQELCMKLQSNLKQHDAALPRIAQLQLRLAQAEEDACTSRTQTYDAGTTTVEVDRSSEAGGPQSEVTRLKAQTVDLGRQLVALRREFAEVLVCCPSLDADFACIIVNIAHIYQRCSESNDRALRVVACCRPEMNLTNKLLQQGGRQCKQDSKRVSSKATHCSDAWSAKSSS